MPDSRRASSPQSAWADLQLLSRAVRPSATGPFAPPDGGILFPGALPPRAKTHYPRPVARHPQQPRHVRSQLAQVQHPTGGRELLVVPDVAEARIGGSTPSR